ncbi:hypothetical protein Tco_0921817, partial [Tanacetum coccineum]
MPPSRSNRVNNKAYSAFTAVVAHAVANLLPTLTARITDEIRQNENNGNNDNRRNAMVGGHISKRKEVMLMWPRCYGMIFTTSSFCSI